MSISSLKEITVTNGSVLEHETEAIFCFRNLNQEGLSTIEMDLDALASGQIFTALTKKDFQGKLFETQMFYAGKDGHSTRVFLLGCGASEKMSLETIRKIGSTVAEKISNLRIQNASVMVHTLDNGVLSRSDIVKEFLIGVELFLYQFAEYKSHFEKRADLSLNLVVDDSLDSPHNQNAISMARKFSAGVYLARDLVNYPANCATPGFLALQATQLAQELNLKCQILEEEDMRKLGMGGVLAVSAGSTEPAKFIVLEHNSDKPDLDTIVLIGKGVTFDSGGISIKPADGMERMKTDMSGAAAVMGAMKSAALMDLPIHLVVLIPTTENMPGGNSFRPSDVIRLMNGKTVEVINTDSEGRLILGDALCYADRYQAKAVIDIATLTGARTVGLGDHAIGLFSNSDQLAGKITRAGEITYERAWRMPLFSEYRDALNSHIADMKNTGGKAGGAIVAAKFLEEFVNEYEWAHLDIAGLVSLEKGSFYRQGYATGIGSRLLTQFLVNWVN